MTLLANRAVVAAAFVVVAVSALVIGSRDVGAQNAVPGSAPVNIVGPLPLPVTGTVTVTNAPTSTTVNNPATNPVLVRDVDVEQREPVQFRGVTTSFTGSSGSTSFVTVPAGKMLVIEHVSASINLPTADGLFGCALAIDELAGDTDFQVCHAMGRNALNFLHAANASTKFYVGPGKTVRFVVSAISGSGGFVSAFASGYYIPAP
jgi:hypothetical protein